MRTVLIRNLRKNTLTLAAIAMLSIIILLSAGLVVGAGGMGMEHATMVGCPFMEGNQALCPMAAIEHLAVWQELDGSMPKQFGIMTVLLTIVLGFVFLGLQDTKRWRWRSIGLGSLQELYERDVPDNGLFVFVKKLFSQGILNPKIFSAYVA